MPSSSYTNYTTENDNAISSIKSFKLIMIIIIHLRRVIGFHGLLGDPVIDDEAEQKNLF